MRKKRIVKVLSIIIIALLAKVTIFGWLHFHTLREVTANIILPIILHILGGLGTVFLAWWLLDEDLRSKTKRDKWEKVLAKAFSDLRRDVWLAGELKSKSASIHPYSTSKPSNVYGRYWIAGLDALRLRLPEHHTQLEHELWSLIHQFDVCNKMLENKSVAEASEQAGFLVEQIKALEPSLRELCTSLSDLEIEAPNFSELFCMHEDDKGFVKFSCQIPKEMATH